MLKLFAFVVVGCFAVVAADTVKYKDCGSVSGTIKNVDITPCPTEPCQFYRTKTINVTVDYTANVAISSATTKVYGFIAGVKVPFPVPSDACMNMTCPITQGSAITYKNSVYVRKEYPSVSVVVQWEVHDQDDKLIICFNVPVQITNGNKTTVSVDISPCSVQPCVFTHNVTATVRVTFKAPMDSSSLKGEIFGYIAGIKVAWPMPNPDGCKDSGITCPVGEGKEYTYTSVLPVPKSAPKLRLVVEWSLTGGSGEKQFCFDFPMEIS